jgi:ribosomal protein S18 acetylase RimI-like enzyme
VAERPQIRLRRAAAADAQGVGAVFDAAVRVGWTYLGDVVESPMFPPEEWDRDVAAHQGTDVMLVAVDDDERVVGFTAVHPEDGEMYLLFVHPDVAGQGVGRLLLDAAHDILRRAGRTEAFLYTHEQNQRALAVYAAAGYVRDGTVRVSTFRGIHLREPRLVAQL